MAEKSTKKRKSKKRPADEAVTEALAQAPVDADASAETVAPEAAGDIEGDAPAGDAPAEPVLTVDELVGPAESAALQESADEPAADAEAPAEAPVSAELKAIVEAMVFASPEPLTPKALCKLLDSEPSEEVLRAIEAIKQDYQQVRGLHLVEIAGGLQIVTRPDLNEWVRRLFHERKSSRLSVPALETLAVIAYRQPVTSAEIAEIRGVNTSGVLSTLVERKLIKTAGRKAVVGRPFLYATTKEFLLRFGLNDISDLPRVEDLADALGFELPGLLNEALPTDQLLPLGEPDEGANVAPEGGETAGEAEEPVADPAAVVEDVVVEAVPAVEEAPVFEEEPVAGEAPVAEEAPAFDEPAPADDAAATEEPAGETPDGEDPTAS